MVVKRRTKAKINIINETRTAPDIIINNNMVKVKRKAKEAITIRVDKAVREEEVAGEWVVQTVDMDRVTRAKDNTPIKTTSMLIHKRSLAV